MAIVTACCLIVSQEASAGVVADAVRFVLVEPVNYESVADLDDMTMSPSSDAANPTTVRSSVPGGPNFAVDSFFDVFTEISVQPPLPQGAEWRVDSFFDVFTELSIGSTDTIVERLAVPVTLGTVPKQPLEPSGASTGSWDTEIIAMSLSGELPGSAPGSLVVRGGRDFGLPSPGHTTLTRVGDGRFTVDSFFDVFTEISIDGGNNFRPGTSPARMQTEPGPSGQRCDQFQGNITTNGVAGGGSGWDGDANPGGDWIRYPNAGDGGPPWDNQWFYNDPLDTQRWKEIYWDIWIGPDDPGDTGDIVEVAINWSNDLYPNGTGQPPMPTEEAFIERFIIGQYVVNGPIDIERIEGFDPPFIIPEFNPEWVSIDVRMIDQVSAEGVRITGEICHECVPEPATMSLLALGGLAVLRRRRRRA